jgi:hypothetical protein
LPIPSLALALVGLEHHRTLAADLADLGVTTIPDLFLLRNSDLADLGLSAYERLLLGGEVSSTVDSQSIGAPPLIACAPPTGAHFDVLFHGPTFKAFGAVLPGGFVVLSCSSASASSPVAVLRRRSASNLPFFYTIGTGGGNDDDGRWVQSISGQHTITDTLADVRSVLVPTARWTLPAFASTQASKRRGAQWEGWGGIDEWQETGSIT